MFQREKPTGFSLCCFVLFVLLFISTELSYGQSKNTEIYHNALNGNFSQNTAITRDFAKNRINSDIATPALISATIEAFLKATQKKIANAANLTGGILDSNEITTYDRIFAYSAKSLLNALEEDYLSALYTSLKAYTSLKQHIKHQSCIEPEIVALSKIFNTVYKKIPSNYWFLLNMAGIDTLTFEKIQPCSVSKYPGLVTTIGIVQQTLKEKDTLKTNQNTPAIGHLLAAAYYIKKQQPGSAEKHLNLIDSSGNQPTAQFYYRGVMHLTMGRYSKAKWYFNKYLFLQQKGRYIKSALLRKKWIAVLQNRPYQQLNKAIESRGTTYTFSDRQALKEYATAYNPALLEVRICFDGGRYEDALQVLTTIKPQNLSPERVSEFYYRKARVYQQLQDYKQALEAYEKLMGTPNTGNYFHKKAMLERGKILMQIGEIDAATKSLNEVKNISSNMYSKVFEQEAALLLEEIENSQE